MNNANIPFSSIIYCSYLLIIGYFLHCRNFNFSPLFKVNISTKIKMSSLFPVWQKFEVLFAEWPFRFFIFSV